MKTKLISHGALCMMLSVAMLSSCISVMATDSREVQKEVQIYLSEAELQEIFRNRDTSFVYLGRETSEIANIVDEISKLDDDRESLVHGLKDHMTRFNIANYASVADTLDRADQILREKGDALADAKRTQLTRSLNRIIDQVMNEQLNLDAEILSFMKDSVEVTEDTTRRGLRLLVIPNKLDVLGSAKFRKDVEFKKHVKIEGFTSVHANAHFRKNLEVDGILSATDIVISGTGTSIGCDITVGCNLNLPASSSATTGNIYKDGVPFISGFGTNNIFIGQNSGNFTTTGGGNVGIGVNTLQANSTGAQNTALGNNSLAANTIGDANTAIGQFTLNANVDGRINTAVGQNALASNLNGSANVAIGHNALSVNLADNNVAVGVNALVANTTGTGHTAVGHQALQSNVDGNNNTAFGGFALSTVTSGSDNIGLGRFAGNGLTTGSGNLYIGAAAGAGAEATTTRIGTAQTRAFIAGIRGIVTGVADAIPVLIDSAGQLGTVSSSIRFKHDVIDMADASAGILNLRPVTFVYNDDATNTIQYGLIAEEVDAIFPGIVVKDAEGKPYTVQYHVMPVLLLNEMKKLAARVAALEAARR